MERYTVGPHLLLRKQTVTTKYTYFEAKTNAFSPLAISGVKGTPVSTAMPEAAEVTAQKQKQLRPRKKRGIRFCSCHCGLMA